MSKEVPTTTLTIDFIERSITTAQANIAFADSDHEKQYFRGVKATLEAILEIHNLEVTKNKIIDKF
jgi:hypothetical protein